MDLRNIYKPNGVYPELRQFAAPYCFELAGRSYDVDGEKLVFPSYPQKTVKHGTKTFDAYIAKATDSLIFALIDKRGYVFDTHSEAFLYIDRKSQGGAVSDSFRPELAAGLGGNDVDWHLGTSQNSIVTLKYTDAGAVVGILTPVRTTVKLDNFVCVKVSEGVYFQYGHAGVGPLSGSVALITDYTKVLCTGAVVIVGDIIPAGGWGVIKQA